jgi:hypothetical protein
MPHGICCSFVDSVTFSTIVRISFAIWMASSSSFLPGALSFTCHPGNTVTLLFISTGARINFITTPRHMRPWPFVVSTVSHETLLHNPRNNLRRSSSRYHHHHQHPITLQRQRRISTESTRMDNIIMLREEQQQQQQQQQQQHSSSSSSSSPTEVAVATAAEEQLFPTEMTEDERYLFDLNGYLIVRNVLSINEISVMNDVIDQHASEMISRNDDALRNAKEGTKLFGSGPARMDLGRVMEWGKDSIIFKSILAHPRLVPLFHGILGLVCMLCIGTCTCTCICISWHAHTHHRTYQMFYFFVACRLSFLFSLFVHRDIVWIIYHL